jgi:hypothetical protein
VRKDGIEVLYHRRLAADHQMMVASTTAAGTMSHTARGVSSFVTRSAIDEAPTAMAAGEQPMDHVRAHPTESDHSELHR